MSNSVANTYIPLLKAASFTARAHKHQIRKDRETPYVAHPFRVCLIVQLVFGVSDPDMLAAALLHDTIEDTNTDRDDLIEQFGPRIAEWVAALSKDKRLPDEQREPAYMQALADGPDAVKWCKLADIFDNLSDSATLSPAARRKAIGRSRMYLRALEKNLSDKVRPAFEIVKQLVGEIEAEVDSR